MYYLMLSLFIVVGLLMILGLINPAWVRFTRLKTRKSVFGVGIGSLALLSIIFFTFYFLFLISVVVSWLMIFGLYKPTWVRFTRLKTRGAIFGVGMGIIAFSMPIAFLFVPEEVEEVRQEMIAEEAKEKARQDRIALERELARLKKARQDSIRELKEKARRDSIALEIARAEKARQDSIALEIARKEAIRKEKARQDSIKWANRPIEEVVKAHAIHRFGKQKVKDVKVFRKGGPKTQTYVEFYSSGHLTRSIHKTWLVNTAFNFFQQIYEDPACNDIDEVIIVVLTDLVDYKGNESIGQLARIRLPRVKNLNYKRLSYQTDDIIRLIKIEGQIEWYVAGYR